MSTTTTRRAILTGAAAIPLATVLPAMGEAATKPAGIDWHGIHDRLAYAVATLHRSHVCPGFPREQMAAEAKPVLAYALARAEGRADGDDEGATPEEIDLMDFAHRYGIRLGWLIDGEVGSFICQSAAAATDKQARADADPVVRLWSDYEATEAQWEALGTHKVLAHPRQDEADALQSRSAEIGDEIARTPATSLAGIIAKVRLAREYYGTDLIGGLLADIKHHDANT